MRKTQPQLFVDPEIKYPIYDLNLNFADYIAQCKSLIAQCRFDLNSSNSERIITANAPFELRPSKPTRCGALLIHGLLDSPLTMRDIGLALQGEGVLTRAILLPGHGTVPGALLDVDYQEWLQAVTYGIASFSQEVDTLFLIGYSTGASLALYHTLKYANKIAGIVLLSPALKIASAFSGIANSHKLISKIWPRAAWLNQDRNETIDYAKYTSIPFNAVHQVHALARAIQKEQSSRLPLLFALVENDNTVCTRASLNYFKQQLHPNNHAVLYTNFPTSVDPRITTRHTWYPNLRIRDFSHLSLPISPKNSHYGENGDYPLASHIETNDQTLYGEFTPFQMDLNEWLFKLKISQYHYQRLTFNPDFDFLMRKINQFLLIK